MKTRLFWYPLPEELIAQNPPEKRGDDRMMVLHRDTGVVEHSKTADFPSYLRPGDAVVVNDTKVFPARLLGTWTDTGGAVELLLVAPAPVDGGEIPGFGGDAFASYEWNCMAGSGRRRRAGLVASFGPCGELRAEFLESLSGEGMWRVRFTCAEPLGALIDRLGRTPVPPYVRREGTPEEEARDRERYQTVYARLEGSVAAPTAGLHFTPEILDAVRAAGASILPVTLHVGPGTFRPVKAENVEDHKMDFEAFSVPPETAAGIEACRAHGGRVFCIGSTVVRTLETVAAAHGGKIVPGEGASDIFIKPPHRFLACDAMLTNFHLPQSTLLMMVSALAGRERILCAYALAVRARYRFFSYGDCMLIV